MKREKKAMLVFVGTFAMFWIGVTLCFYASYRVITDERACLDYTLKEFREGNAPAKCQAEVYGDQF